MIISNLFYSFFHAICNKYCNIGGNNSCSLHQNSVLFESNSLKCERKMGRKNKDKMGGRMKLNIQQNDVFFYF